MSTPVTSPAVAELRERWRTLTSPVAPVEPEQGG